MHPLQRSVRVRCVVGQGAPQAALGVALVPNGQATRLSLGAANHALPGVEPSYPFGRQRGPVGATALTYRRTTASLASLLISTWAQAATTQARTDRVCFMMNDIITHQQPARPFGRTCIEPAHWPRSHAPPASRPGHGAPARAALPARRNPRPQLAPKKLGFWKRKDPKDLLAT